jgi:outer membrane protein OmpA-like peptidoglycan-associated protein
MAFKGCPDTDGDGISDKDDRCPTVKGTFENKGCPEIAKVDIQRITVIAGKIYFETGSAKLKLISNSSLDDLSVILKRNEVVNLTIEGHTDNVGDDEYNMTLSQQRTESVKAYLIAKGISAERLTAIGYGETKPVADNTKAAGKAKNRRVELKTSY